MQARISARVAAADLLPDRLLVPVVTEQPISARPTPVAVALGSSEALAQRVVAAAVALAAIRPEQPEPLTPAAVVVALEATTQLAVVQAVRVVPASCLFGIPERLPSQLEARSRIPAELTFYTRLRLSAIW